MSENKQKTILVGVTGCIAAYKSALLVRCLQKAGYRVKVVMTEHATEFVGPVTFRSLTHEPVAVGLFDNPSDPIHHISLAEEADLFLIAPCTANVIGKIAHGIADDLLSTTAMATTAPLVVAPAMNVHMFDSAANQDNLKLLESRGVHVIQPDSGYLACGYEGRGRMPDPEVLVEAVQRILEAPLDLAGKKVMITAGPTYEPIDPVRFIGNRSSGKSGYALAQAAAKRGAQVTLVSGPVSLPDPAGVDVIRVGTALEMLDAARAAFEGADVAIFTAAVADLRPANPADAKLKKGSGDARLDSIELVQNPDILATLAAEKGNTLVIGYAAETDDVLGYARGKLVSKNADVIVANQVGNGKAFGTDDNQVWFVDAEGNRELPLMPKDQLADAVLDEAVRRLNLR